MPAHRYPFRMVIDPLRDVRLRGHGALIERHVRRELQMPILAMIGSRQRHTVSTISMKPIGQSPSAISQLDEVKTSKASTL